MLYLSSITQLVGLSVWSCHRLLYISSNNKERSTTYFGLIYEGHLQVVLYNCLVDLSAVVGGRDLALQIM
jgi:hypothetical protein